MLGPLIRDRKEGQGGEGGVRVSESRDPFGEKDGRRKDERRTEVVHS